MNQEKQRTKEYDLFNHYRNKGLFFKADIIIAIILIAAIVVSIVFITNKKQGEFVEIYYKGELIERYPLNCDITIMVEKSGHNEIVIDDSKVFIKTSDCENQICVKTVAIRYAGQRIICAPNGVVVIITGEQELDGITGGQNGS